MKVSKNCETSNEGKCKWVSYRPDTKAEKVAAWGMTKFYLADGTFIFVAIRHFNEKDGRIGFIVADLNGQKEPNTIGIDQFWFSYRLHKGKLYPYGVETSTNRNYHLGTGCGGWDYCCSEDGTFCSALIALDGWQIKDDYPWF